MTALTSPMNNDGQREWSPDKRVNWAISLLVVVLMNWLMVFLMTLGIARLSFYYRGRVLRRAKGGGISGNHIDTATGHEYWISGVKRRGSNAHYAEPVKVKVDDDAVEEYNRIRAG